MLATPSHLKEPLTLPFSATLRTFLPSRREGVSAAFLSAFFPLPTRSNSALLIGSRYKPWRRVHVGQNGEGNKGENRVGDKFTGRKGHQGSASRHSFAEFYTKGGTKCHRTSHSQFSSMFPRICSAQLFGQVISEVTVRSEETVTRVLTLLTGTLRRWSELRGVPSKSAYHWPFRVASVTTQADASNVEIFGRVHLQDIS